MKRWIAVDTETTGLNPWVGDRPFMVSWCWDDETTGWCRWKVDPFTRAVKPNPQDISMLKEILEDESVTKVFHNAKFDVRMLSFVGIDVKGKIEDTSYALRVLHSNLFTYKLKPVCKKFFNFSDEDEKVLKKETMTARRAAKLKGWKIAEAVEADYWLVPPEVVNRYAVNDALRTYTLWKMCQYGLRQDAQDLKIYRKEMRDLYPCTYKMESRGVRINLDYVDEEIAIHEKNYAEHLKPFMEVAAKYGMKDINLNSTAQIGKLFYEHLKLPVLARTETGQPAADSKTIDKLYKLHPHKVLEDYLQCKSSNHALNQFFYKYKYFSRQEGDIRVLHPTFKQTDTKTGRYACAEPNLQNVPNALNTRSSIPIQARRPFQPRPGYSWLSFDYSQLEVYIFAMVAQEPFILNALLSGRDLHTETANHVWGKGIDIVSKEKAADGKSNTRAKAKMMLFGKVYGMGAGGATELIGCSLPEAKKYLQEYDEAFPGIKSYMQKISREGIANGYIRNVYGRKYQIDPRAAYRACNYEVQGSAADLIKEKIIEVNAWLEKNHIDAYIVLTIHDEIIVEIANRFLNLNVIKKIKAIMEDHHGVFSIDRFRVSAALIPTNGTWDKKKEIKL